jgi:glycosyltransferase involved in cell wall biosynthesis
VPSKFYGILAAGKPVVAAVDEGCEVALVVEESDCGKRVSPGDASVLAGAISELRKDDLAGMGKRARAVFEARFTRAKSTASYQQVLEELAGGGTGAQASL